MDGYINGYLNAQEQALYNANRAKGLLCIANAKTAIDLTKARYVNTIQLCIMEMVMHLDMLFGTLA
ncbi:hypothetical protein [Acinetobacter nosocomialis]|uniref:hypothetical protein n=1 Tax=Acinetobacter nosocomialis TaxID=106654 RepID=UPI000679D6FB|nr:hypothetical protein [Acinetobacter nosocomialis]